MRKVNISYLVAYLFVTLLLLYYPPIAETSTWNWNVYVCICGAGAFSYSYFVVSSHASFWKGLGAILAISVIAQVVEAIVYLVVSSRFLYLDTVALVFIGLMLAASLAAEVVCYPMGYAAFWSRYRRKCG